MKGKKGKESKGREGMDQLLPSCITGNKSGSMMSNNIIIKKMKLKRQAKNEIRKRKKEKEEKKEKREKREERKKERRRGLNKPLTGELLW